jgi:hypothetical protein
LKLPVTSDIQDFQNWRSDMRSIQVSTETFAAIWKAQEPGEASEEAILRRLLKVKGKAPEETPARDFRVTVGFHDPRFGVTVPNGFPIFRTYRGTEYAAQAIQGFWVLNVDGKGYGSLNELSRAIGIASENAWANWFFRDEKGRKRPLSDLRDPSKIARRTQR